MNTNAVADSILAFLEEKHERVFRNKSPKSPVFPYVVFRLESISPSNPSEDYYLNVDIYEDSESSVRPMEDLADDIDGNGKYLNPTGLNQKTINTDLFSAYFDREQRQHVPAEELVGSQAINMRYNTRIYFK